MNKELLNKFEEAIKSILNMNDTVFVHIDRKDDKFKIEFTLTEKGNFRLGGIYSFINNGYRVLFVDVECKPVIDERELHDLSTTFIIKKVLDVAEAIGMELTFLTNDKENQYR